MANKRQAAAEALAKQMQQEEEDESGFGSFMSIAAPLAASLILPGVGTAIMGQLGGMAGGGGALASLLGGAGTAAGSTAATAGTGLLGALAGTGTGALSTIGGGLLTGAGKAAGHLALSELMEKGGRGMGYGADEGDIDLSAHGGYGRKAQAKARGDIKKSKEAMGKGQLSSALMAGALGGIKQAGGFDKLKEMSSGIGEKIGAGQMPWTSDAEYMEKMANLTEEDLVDGQLKPNQLTNIQRITGYDDYVDPMDDFFGGDSILNETSYSPKGISILDSLTQYPQIMDYFANNPDMTEEEKEEILASIQGGS